METKENNILIANYLKLGYGEKYFMNPLNKNNILTAEELLFDKSWDWLRVVMDKIWKWSDDHLREFGGFTLFELGLFSSIDDVYNAVVHFIKVDNASIERQKTHKRKV